MLPTVYHNKREKSIIAVHKMHGDFLQEFIKFGFDRFIDFYFRVFIDSAA